MAMNRRDRVAVGAAGLFALLMPAALLFPRGVPDSSTREKDSAPLRPVAPAALAAAYERPLFAAAPAAAEGELPADAPQLVGVVGRLGQDAVALVRSEGGPARALRIGESVDGWRLASLAIDAAFFTRGAKQIRVPLPAVE